MKMSAMLILLMMAALLSGGCKTTEVEEETVPIGWEQQQAFMDKARDPRVYGLHIYNTPEGPKIRGANRLHPRQAEVIDMLATDPLRPVLPIVGKHKEPEPVILDFSSPRSWLSFDLADSLGVRAVAEMGKPTLVKLRGEEIPGCESVAHQVRFGQLHIENVLLYTRMATGSIGSLNRGVESPPVKGVIGWDVLKNLEQIRLLYSVGKVALLTTDPYRPNPANVIAALPLVDRAGVCAVRTVVDGKEAVVRIDPAGDYELACESPIFSVQFTPDLVLSSIGSATLPGGPRIGAQLLKQYDVTICPQAGMIYFEKQPEIVEETEAGEYEISQPDMKGNIFDELN